MVRPLQVFLLLGVLGALDTLYYHEWKLRLPTTPGAAPELRLHAIRDFNYAILFGTLAWTTFNGLLVWLLVGILLSEVVITLSDFLEEDRTRRLPRGERVMHAVMGITYGFFLALLYPNAAHWATLSTGFRFANYGVVSWALTTFGFGTLASGLRDFAASRGSAK